MRRLLTLLPVLLVACGGGAIDSPDTVSDADISEPDAIEVSAGDDSAAPAEPDPPATENGCNPIAAEWDCLLPYPSDVFRVPHGEGHRIVVPEAALPTSYYGDTVHMLAEHPTDGAGIHPQIVVMMPRAVDATVSKLPFHDDDVSVSTGLECPTVLLDTETGDRVPHFSEVDLKALAFGDEQPLAVRPFGPLEMGRRYVVALRGLVDPDGTAIAPPVHFREVRDDGDDAWYEARVFAPLAEAGVERADLILAWDFTTASEDSLTRDMRTVVDGVVDAVSGDAGRLLVISVQDDVDDHVFRRIEGTLTVPLYVDTAEPGARLLRDSEGHVTSSGSAEASWVALIPRSVAEQPADAPPARLLQFGHGFFGSVGEMGGYPAQLADEKGFVLVGMDWWGMSSPDRVGVIGALADAPEEALRFVERTHQGMANAIALGVAATEQFAGLDAFSVDGRVVVDPERLFFLGISQGHILGGTYAGLSPRVDAVALTSGGAGFGFIMTRSRSFGIFRLLIDSTFPGVANQQRTLALLAPSLDRIDPALWSRYAEVPVLLQTGLGDTEVPALTTHVHARALGAGLLGPAVRAVPGIAESTGPAHGSMLVEYDLGYQPEPTSAWGVPEAGTSVHEEVRRLPAVKEQIDLFLREGGLIENTCGGVCDAAALQ